MEIRRYTTANGRCPVDEYLNRLPREERAEIIAVLESVAKDGLKAPLVSMRHIEGRLWELRISRTRIFYVVVLENAMVLLHAYKKQSQKAPRTEISTAHRRMADVMK